jgi:hypothetical protein
MEFHTVHLSHLQEIQRDLKDKTISMFDLGIAMSLDGFNMLIASPA